MMFQNAIAAIASLLITTSLYASPVAINPTSDGSLYVCDGCNIVSDGAYLFSSGDVQGAVKFSTSQIPLTFSEALLSLNPFALPLWELGVDVYGYGSAIGSLDESDANAGSFLGTLILPANLGYGQDAYFDVTSFVSTINAPYVAFNLRSSGPNVFSSLEFNYGHPSRLLITPVPEPSTMILISAGLILVFSLSSNKRKYR